MRGLEAMWSRRFLTRSLSVLIACLLAGGAAQASNDSAASIRALLQRSADYWNQGRLDAFMESYERSPATTYVSAKTIVHGYDNIERHYASKYGGRTGTLSFSDFSVRSLGADYAVVVARWHLAMPDGKHPSGLFTLVLHRSTSGWHIITDHSP
jgi:ketosteroid isomerase-like protein